MAHTGFRGFLVCVLVTSCGGGGGEVVVLNPGDGLPVEAFYGMDAADVNGDGFVDIVAISTFSDGNAFLERRLNVFLQDPAAPGTFMAPERLVHDQGASIWHLRAVDLKLNGLPDLVAQQVGVGDFMVFEQDPANPGRFLDATRFGSATPAPGSLIESIDIADVDGDLFPDVVTTSGNDAVLFHQDPMALGTFEGAIRVAEGEDTIAVSDVNGDGVSDLLTFRTHPNEDDIDIADTALIHIQDASNPGSYFGPLEISFDFVGGNLGATDVDGDGLTDIVINGAKSIGNDITHHLAIYRQVFPGQFVQSQLLLTGGDILAGKQVIADLDGDGDPEIVIAYRNSAVNPNLVEIFDQNALGDYRSLGLMTIPDDRALWNPELFALRIADLNADGQADITVSTYELFVFFQRTGSPGVYEAPVRIAGQR